MVESSEDYLVGKWYVVEFENEKTSFASYDSALEFACNKEFESFVTSLELDDVNNFTQYHLIASRGTPEDDVRVGTYWRYKSQANSDNELYYFDETLLKEVIAHYAKEYVSGVNYFTLDENTYGDISDDMFDNTWMSFDGIEAHIANDFVFTQFDSNEVYAELVGGGEGKVPVEFGVPLGEQFNITGLYEVTEIDEAGNSSSYYVFLDFSAPNLVVNAEVFGDGEIREITITSDSVSSISTYYYKSFEVSQIVDNDSWATIAITNEGKTTYYSKGDELPVLNVGGKYDVQVYDRFCRTALAAYQQACKKTEIQQEAYQLNQKRMEQGLISGLEYQTAVNNYLKTKSDDMKSLFTYLIKQSVLRYYSGVEYVNQL